MFIELRFVQFWSEIILVISNRTRAAGSFHFESGRHNYHYLSSLLEITKIWESGRALNKFFMIVQEIFQTFAYFLRYL